MQSALEAIDEYYKAFSTLDLRAIVSCYSEPCVTVAARGVFAAADHAGLAEALRPLVDGLKARGYGRSEFVQAHVTALGEADAIVRGVAVRYTVAGSEMERVSLSYLMHRGGDGWKIVALVAES